MIRGRAFKSAFPIFYYPLPVGLLTFALMEGKVLSSSGVTFRNFPIAAFEMPVTKIFNIKVEAANKMDSYNIFSHRSPALLVELLLPVLGHPRPDHRG
jgi:hypothetical protein